MNIQMTCHGHCYRMMSECMICILLALAIILIRDVINMTGLRYVTCYKKVYTAVLRKWLDTEPETEFKIIVPAKKITYKHRVF